MPKEHRVVAPGPSPRCARAEDGSLLEVPQRWVLVPPGDSALTRRIKQAGPAWQVQDRRGRRTFTRGVWADAETVEGIRQALAVERANPAYTRKREADQKRRQRAQAEYVQAFRSAVLDFLGFAPAHAALALALAEAITDHAAPVNSGTVARTQRIPLPRRAEAATIAWLRHQTTEYDSMSVPRVKGMRRELRRLLAERSRKLLGRYRAGTPVDPASCPLRRALTPTTLAK